MPIDPKLVYEVFLAAIKLSPDRRAEYLDEVGRSDPDLRVEVERLLTEPVDPATMQKPSSIPLEATGGFEPKSSNESKADKPFHATATFGEKTQRTDIPVGPNLGTLIAGRYSLIEVIGEGGMGSVYLASQTEPVKRQVALKLIKTGMDSKVVLARFDAERQALALMDHPNIARIYDGGVTASGQPFFVMELVKGVPLTQYCDMHRLSVDDRLQLFVSVCNAVQHAHQKGIIHRDLKPGNVLVTEVDGRPTPKVIDFGVAKATEQKLTDMSLADTGAIVGTPAYMSPEQADPSSMDIDTRTDVYALGVMLYELLTGSPPIDASKFKRGAILEMLRMVREVEPPRPSTKLSTGNALPNIAANRSIEPAKLAKLLQGELDWVVMKALEKDRTRRYETANGLARDIQRYLADEVVEARPPSASYRLKKFVRRHKGQVVAVSLVRLALIGGIIGTSLGFIQAQSERDVADQARIKAQESENLAIEEAGNARTANKLAQARLAQVEKGNDLLLSIFRDIDPRVEEKEGKPLRAILSDRIDQVVGQLKESVGDSLTVAKLQARLGVAQLNLGQFKRAISLYSTALQTQEELLGPDHPDTLDTRSNLAEAYRFEGRTDEAITMEEEILKLRSAKLGPDHPDTLESRNNLAEGYRFIGQTDKAITMHEETLKLRSAKLGPDHRDTLSSRSNLANSYTAASRLAEAIAMHEGTLKLSIDTLGPGYIDTIVSRINLAAAYRIAGQLPEAINMHEETLKLSVANLGPDHHITLVTRINLASAYRFAGRLTEAIAMNEETFKLSESKLGSDHPETLACRNNLAESYRLAGRTSDAIRMHEETLKLRITKLSLDHPDTLQSRNNLAEAYESLNRWAEAESLRREIVSRRRKTDPNATVILTRDLSGLGRVLLYLKKWSEAESVLLECSAIQAKSRSEDWWRFNTMSLLGGAMLGQKKYAGAEPLLLKGYEGMRQREKTIPPPGKDRLPEALDRLVELYKATNKPEEAKKWQAEKAKYCERLPAPKMSQ